MEKKPLESLTHEIFENLPEETLGYAAGGIIRSSATRASVTHVGKIFDEEFVD